ncbi:GH36-type glycosyl hydrolase domain-containing protein [Schlesneria paludicola]|uniref:GH36-type glycosyl hydrolase domain-containing protein n=1 Tax=Schlesneria paludicola TaxID=360056 RepID=UPI00029B450D|nr:glucoamylase family protein [Schlesneria paludicola]
MAVKLKSKHKTPDAWRFRDAEKPLRAEAYSGDHLAAHARDLAVLLKCKTSHRGAPGFFKRYADNAEFLRDSIAIVAAGAREGLELQPEAEWLLDNFYVVEEQLREIRDDLPRRYFRELPKTASGEPRVYALAVELVMHTDSVLDEESIVRFVNEFQTVAALSMGEIWAVPIMLRLVLTENLRRIAAQMLCSHASERMASQILETWPEGESCPFNLSPIDECRSLIFHLIDKLQQDGASNLERIRELERGLARHDLTIQQTVHLEHQRQASSQVSIGNVITSMRLITAIDWVSFFERTNLSEQILRSDPAGIYGRMDFESRDRYRHVVEDLTEGCNLTEAQVAETAVKLAEKHDFQTDTRSHVGYWLVDRGLDELEKSIHYRPKFVSLPSRWLKRHPVLTYQGGIAVLMIAVIAAGLWQLRSPGVTPLWFALVGLLAILPASELAVGLMNTLVTSWLRPRLLPKLDFSTGIPAGHQSIVVVPCMLSRRGEVKSLLQRLEMHYLANPDPALSFALLSDFPDAAQEVLPSDAALLAQACTGIQELNAKHAIHERGPFFLFHRARKWNEQERTWMGWERKRGKLMEFNRLLRGHDGTSFVVQEGDLKRLLPESGRGRTRYVITLDADTTLPHDAARRMIETLAHPLNVAVFNSETHRVTSGYVVLQPRVTVNLASADNSRFAQVFANNPGLDPYSTCASDVYQDLFGEGSFTGKGIYEVDTFEQALADAFPENQILSHDLIEGCHARVGLVSDIELFDNYPAKYEADVKRQHRWVRGDWQIATWLLPFVPWAHGWRANRLSFLSRWKIFDNLRRSLVAPSLMLFLLTGWFALPRAAWMITGGGMLILAFPMLAQFAMALRSWPRNSAVSDYLQVIWKDLKRSSLQTFLLTSFLPLKAWSMVDAIVRTLFRMTVSHHKLLEWATAADVERQLAQKRKASLLQWGLVPGVTLGIAFLLRPEALAGALPFLAPWLVSPLLLRWLDRPPRVREESALAVGDRRQLRTDARRIWAFFETYVGPRDHWLPPDNIQEYPEEKIAHRISPTNEGLYLVSGLVARDFGYLSISSLVEIWERNLAQWQTFDRYEGHFYNWYDTATLEALLPRYVSTVDSGNLAACLLTIERGVEELRRAPIVDAFLQAGVEDTVAMIIESAEQLELTADKRTHDAWQHFANVLSQLQIAKFHFANDPRQWLLAAQHWQTIRPQIAEKLEPLSIALHGTSPALLSQVRLLLDWLTNISQEIEAFYPWLPQLQADIVTSTPTDEGAQHRLRWLPVDSECESISETLWKQLSAARSPIDVQQLLEKVRPVLDELRNIIETRVVAENRQQSLDWLAELTNHIREGADFAESLDHRLRSVAAQSETLAMAMDFGVLFNPQRKLFSIGYNMETGRLDGSHYDMLCSEARLASFLAIAKGDVESRHWFRLGRQMTFAAGQLSLLSWGGTMFEYLMPHLFQKTYTDSILAQSCRAAVARQKEYGRQRGVAWGISECAFGALAANSDYHYRSFGVPGLGLKRGLSKDLVISPYSTLLALDFDSHGCVSNLQRIRREGGLGLWGYYESLDYTPERVPAGKRAIVVRCYMAHHQGMSLLSLGNFLKGSDTRRRFHDHPLVRATELLLQERTPITMPKLEAHADEQTPAPEHQIESDMVSRRIVGVATAVPRLQLLSNGQYHVMVTSTGGGYSQHQSLGVTRWRSDATRDHWGQFLYLRDLGTDDVWSATYQPTCVEPTRYEAIYSIDKAEFFRRDGFIDTHLEIAVSPENNSEMRQLKITNTGPAPREIEVTSYAEVSLVEPNADLSHSSFQKLFIETEYVADKAALLARRRPRDAKQPPIFAVHALSASSEVMATIQYETSRQTFLGRGRTPQSPAALDPDTDLSGTVGAVLDPIFSLRCRVTIPPDESISVAFTTSIAATREEAIILADQYHESRGVQRGFELAWAYSQVELRHLHLSAAKMHQYQRLASAMLYPDRTRRPAAERLQQNRLGQRGLWRYGISGAVPMMVVYVTKPEQIDLVREAVGAHQYWRGRGLKSELVIVNDFPGSYLDAMQDQLVELMQQLQIRLDEKPGYVFILRGAQIAAEDKTLLEAAASVVLFGDRGPFSKQIEVGTTPATPKSANIRLENSVLAGGAARTPAPSVEPFSTDGIRISGAHRFETIPTNELEFWNGYGGFARDGREYHICLNRHQSTPMPWSNVMANPKFGCLVTESGGGYTWFGNSRENKLTTWVNDPVSDTMSEALYLYDFDSGEIFSPMAGVKRDNNDHWVQHGQGYTRFVHRSNGLSQDVLVTTAPDESIKFIVLTLRNERDQFRRLSATYYVEWVLGVCREDTQMHVVTSIDEKSGALMATNAYHPELPEQAAFLQVMHQDRSWTGDRTEFIGRNGTPTHPVAVGLGKLSGRTGAGLDPCGAVQASIRLGPQQEIQLVFLLGAAENLTAAGSLLDRYNSTTAIRQACDETVSRWNETLETIEIKTPDRAFDLIVNRWLLYQTISCRILGRSAYYQAGGAYGFRDQLQDTMAAVYSQPALARHHILTAASRQFEEGDVQHWWHPPEGRGTRTRFSDDLLWMPFVVCHYLTVTGDHSILDQDASFLTSPLLEPHEQERYEIPSVSSQRASLYEHCRRAIERGFRLGVHGLPLMGCGDWNDGMNKVGEEGRGESVWVGWFLLVILDRFIPLMESRGDTDRADAWKHRSAELRNALEENAWDGEWYRRAYFDDGTPLGSAQNDECQIDSIAQTWSVIADADPARSRQAVESVMKRLVRWQEGLVLLFTPPFNTSSLDPGYIKGYVPGIRENGGQYTHSATWLIQALTLLNDGERAAKVFELVNPINHALTQDDVHRYQVEPYVVAADVYGVAPHVGRGGWTWYTGSASWLYRAAIEFILGFEQHGQSVRFSPKLPSNWDHFELSVRRDSKSWDFKITRLSDGAYEIRLGLDRTLFAPNEMIPLDRAQAVDRDPSKIAEQSGQVSDGQADTVSANGWHRSLQDGQDPTGKDVVTHHS